ncbi:hypothetical protein [uncultured Jatrophihabitans sp.]|uniref:hypothetical protein n=1 Tax=uncultured Jatrophihabitans sp. TaxID=1610747 RepID=UPI0035CC759D
MPTPPPAVLKAAATDLRECAVAQRGHASSCETLLDAVTKFTNDTTWSGTYPDQVNAQIAGWARDLTATASAMRADAKAWDSAATTFEDEAGKAHSG